MLCVANKPIMLNVFMTNVVVPFSNLVFGATTFNIMTISLIAKFLRSAYHFYTVFLFIVILSFVILTVSMSVI